MPREKQSADDSEATREVRCCLCQGFVTSWGYCPACERYPINVTPYRRDEQNHSVGPEGWCAQCDRYTLTHLEPEAGAWRDTGRYSRRLTLLEVRDLAKAVADTLDGPGWPEKTVPLRRDMIPRRWKRGPLKVVGQTPLGYDIVLPETEPEPPPDADVPF